MQLIVFNIFLNYNILVVCLCGEASAVHRLAALKAVDSSADQNFMIVFTLDRALRFKGVYTVDY